MTYVTTKFQLVDYENVGKFDFANVADDTTVILFFGSNQNSVPRTYLAAAQTMGARFVSIDITGQGKNALDFHLAFYLGEILTLNPKAECVIVSGDTGFDLLVTHLCKRGFVVSRPERRHVAAKKIAQAFNPEALSAVAKQSFDWLNGTQKNKRPRKRTSLVNHLHSHFSKKFPGQDFDAVVTELIIQHALSENNANLTYHF